MKNPPEIYVSTDGGKRMFDGVMRDTRCIEETLEVVTPGQTVRLSSGVYTQPFEIVGKHGPITIRGESGVTFDGRRSLVRPPHGEEIGRAHYAFVKILDSSAIRLENLAIQNVWPTAVYIEKSQDVELRRLNLHGGTYAIFARGETTRRILAERCAWTGDVSIWDGVDWKDIHVPPHPRRELDGDFFRSVDIAGDVVIRNNMIQHVFNGVHLFASSEALRAGRSINHDVWVYENTFAFIRDNVIEAERHAYNWWIFGNRIYNGHKWFAFEKATGGYWYIFANVGWFDRRPGPAGDDHVGGAVFKENSGSLPTKPVYVFHNTWYLRSSYVKAGRVANLQHFNNAVVYARASDHRLDLVDDEKAMFGAKFLSSWKPGDAKFDHDFCSHPHYRLLAALSGGAAVTTVDEEPRFKAREEHQFAPADGSPLLNASAQWKIHLPDGGEWASPAGLNLGAVKSFDETRGQDVAYTPKDLGYRSKDGYPDPSPEWATKRDV
jgi:hypothetical protein